MDNNRSFKYALIQLFFMSLSLAIPLIVIGASKWVISSVSLIVFVSALCGNAGIAYIYRILHNIILRPGLYIWALVVSIKGQQDVFSVAFYIIFVCQLKNIVTTFIGEIIILLSLGKQ